MRRARVAAVDDGAGLGERVDARADDGDGRARDVDPRRRARPSAAAGAAHVVAAGEADDAGPAVGDRGEQQRPVRDALVARHPQPARAAGADRAATSSVGCRHGHAHGSGVRATW